MVLLIGDAPALGLAARAHIDDGDVDLLGKLVLASALASGYLYADEVVLAVLAEPIGARWPRSTGSRATTPASSGPPLSFTC
jgi:molybdopterin-containing oxidoreductase family membrane subunit